MTKIRYSDEFICPKCGRHTALVCRTDGTHQAHCMICDVYYDVEIAKTTNADRIRSMTDEELAGMMAHGNCGYCKIHDYCFSQKGIDCDEAWLGWLRQEAITDG